MSAYVVIRITVHDQERLKGYQQIAPSIIEKYNGKILVRGGDVMTLEGPEENRRIVMIEFPDVEAARRFYHSDEYSHAISLRKEAADFEMIAIQGIE